jgi:hypothetical protein
MTRSRLASLAVLLAALGAMAAEPPPPSANTGVFEELKPGPGRELVLGNCLLCHSTAVIAASHQTRERWDRTITKMQTQNGLWPIAPEIRNQILDYLAATQPPSDPGLEKAKETPWAAPLYRPNPLWR